MLLQLVQRLPHFGDRRRRVAPLQRLPANPLVRVQRPAPVQGADGDRLGVGDAQVADRDGHQGAMLDRPAHRCLQGSGLVLPQPQDSPHLPQRAATALMRPVHLDHGVLFGLLGDGRKNQRPRPGGADHPQPVDHEPAFAHRAHRVVQRHLQRGGAADQDHQRADEPADRQTQQRTGRHDGADDQVDRDERQQQPPPPVPPARRQPRARHGEHRGQHADPARVVEELREDGAQPVVEVEMPLRGGQAGAGDRQRENGDQRGRRVRDQQSPLPGENQAEQDHERQRQHREAVHQVDHVGLGRRQHPDDAGDGHLQPVPARAGDQRTGDHDRQQRPRQRDPQDVVGAAGQGLQQAARNPDFATIDLHGPHNLRPASVSVPPTT